LLIIHAVNKVVINRIRS